MALTEFGKALRKARIDSNETLGSMADALGVSPGFLSGVETGRKKIPADLIGKIKFFLQSHNVSVENIDTLAAVSNQSVSLEGLSPQHQMLVAGFARSTLDGETLQKMAELLAASERK
ncbi:helix-turn-helix domain-containing protein [Comamonas squillarum]|uniref:Helix-turn-helix domain-containing protein n=1 Tax=Comamonas squillarum TaxID=2977320 RepID=A0ABY6A275_9BURK|nr:helix-turn-helix transcriptional regulator [Comamonas sp. PR12]UXC20044.1 helix-turn-helix domain-containing protein [Comamonas sp. PR12]